MTPKCHWTIDFFIILNCVFPNIFIVIYEGAK